MPTILIECQSLPGETTATAAVRDGDATGTVTSVTLAAQVTDGLYWATLNYADAGSRPLGRWAVDVGGFITIATLTTDDDVYTMDSAFGNVPSAADNASATRDLLGSGITQVPSPNVGDNLVLTQGDSYDGIGNAKVGWVVTTDYTDGWSVALTIRDADDTVVQTDVGSVDSATAITVTMDAPTGLTMTGCPGVWQGKFDLQLVKGSTVKTIAIGKCYINENQTR